MISDAQVEAAFDTLQATIETAAKARAERLWIEKFLDHKIALLMKEHDVFDLAVNAQEREAKADPEYALLLEGFKAAVFFDERERNTRDTAKSLIDAWRTQSATDRAARV